MIITSKPTIFFHENIFQLWKGIFACISAKLILNGYKNQKMWDYVLFRCLLIFKIILKDLFFCSHHKDGSNLSQVGCVFSHPTFKHENPGADFSSAPGSASCIVTFTMSNSPHLYFVLWWQLVLWALSVGWLWKLKINSDFMILTV